MKDRNSKNNQGSSRNDEQGSKKNKSRFLNVNQQKDNDPHADRSAKTSRKGAGQQQGSGGSPINS